MYGEGSSDWVPTVKSKQVKEEDNGLLGHYSNSFTYCELDSQLLHVSADFMDEAYLWSELLYLKRTRDPRRFLWPWTKALYVHLGLFPLLGVSHGGNVSRLYLKQRRLPSLGPGRVSIGYNFVTGCA